MVHTGDESPQDRLRDVQTCKMTLASLCAMLSVYCVVVTSDKRKKSKMGVSTD